MLKIFRLTWRSFSWLCTFWRSSMQSSLSAIPAEPASSKYKRDWERSKSHPQCCSASSSTLKFQFCFPLKFFSASRINIFHQYFSMCPNSQNLWFMIFAKKANRNEKDVTQKSVWNMELMWWSSCAWMERWKRLAAVAMIGRCLFICALLQTIHTTWESDNLLM